MGPAHRGQQHLANRTLVPYKDNSVFYSGFAYGIQYFFSAQGFQQARLGEEDPPPPTKKRKSVTPPGHPAPNGSPAIVSMLFQSTLVKFLETIDHNVNMLINHVVSMLVEVAQQAIKGCPLRGTIPGGPFIPFLLNKTQLNPDTLTWLKTPISMTCAPS